MKINVLKCPNCGGDLEIEDGIDTFFCKYCGEKIFLEGQSDSAYEAKVRVKHIEYREKLQDKRNEQERYKIEIEQKEKSKTFKSKLIITGIIAVAIIFIMLYSDSQNRRYEKELNATIEQIMNDIEAERFGSAYIKAQSLYFEGASTESKEKWNEIRSVIIKQIEEAEIEATGKSTNPSKEVNKK